MKLNEIRTFVAVAEARSVQEAAGRLRLTQSAVSRLIQRMEAEVGVALFDRQSKRLTLTRDGELALAHGRRVLKEVESFTDAFAPVGEPEGLLRLGVSHVLARLLAGGPLDRIRAVYPRMTVRLQSDWSAGLLAATAAGALEGALVLLPAREDPPPGLDGRRLVLEEVHIVGTPDLLARHGRSLETMNAAGWVLQPEGCGYRTALERALGGDRAPLNVLVEAFDQELLLSLAARGIGFGAAPLRLLADPQVSGRLVPVQVPGFRLTVAVWLVRARHGGRLSRVFDTLDDSLTEDLMPMHSAAE
ncbi:LysR family transcriptional regulator [Azospirillum halopraeferens]|uniref:LysR family transcriptional regulator n=1 Tax=Azospirillum halopraeferens TaxID=34010 RepID=UPI0003F77123|nr:LysR family transcriptional regulator [Azospirillum halopraeferens]